MLAALVVIGGPSSMGTYVGWVPPAESSAVAIHLHGRSSADPARRTADSVVEKRGMGRLALVAVILHEQPPSRGWSPPGPTAIVAPVRR